MKIHYGQLFTGDFEEKTMIFKIENEMELQAGNYVILKRDDYSALTQANGANSENANCAIFDVSKMLPSTEQIQDEAVKYRTKQWSPNKDDDIYTECENCEDDFIAGVDYCIKFIEGNFC